MSSLENDRHVNQQAELTVLPEMTNTNIFNDNHHAATTAGILLPLPTTTSELGK
jgi:predicted amidohydrolase